MNLIFKTWLPNYKELNTEKGSVMRWDIWNKTKFKSKVENGQLTSEEVAKHNHQNNLGYELCVFNEEHQEYPFAYITIVPENRHIGIQFLDFSGRKYLHYLFGESKKGKEKLFLGEVWYYHFTSETLENEDYRLHFVFDEDGNISYRKYDEKEQKIEDYEGNRALNVESLYEEFPDFGKYENFLVENRPALDEFIPKQKESDDKNNKQSNKEDKKNRPPGTSWSLLDNED